MLDYHKTGNGLIVSGRFNDGNSMNAVKIVTRNKFREMNFSSDVCDAYEAAVTDTMKLVKNNFVSLKEEPKFTIKFHEKEGALHIDLYTNMDSMNETDMSPYHFIEKTMDSFSIDFDESSKMSISMKKTK